MRLPVDTIIAEDKLVRYLLLPQIRGDKSAFLAQAGYVLENASQLLHDLRTQIVSVDAVPWSLISSDNITRSAALLSAPMA